MVPAAQQHTHFRLAEMAFVDHQLIVDQYPLVPDRLAVGRHGAGGDPANVGMVSSRRDERGGLTIIAIENRNDHRDIGQVGAAAIGIVEDIGVAAADAAPVPRAPARFDDGVDTLAHRAEVHGDMRRVGDQRAG